MFPNFLLRRGKNTRHGYSCRRAGATPNNFWAAGGRKSAVAPARFCDFFGAGFFFATGFFLGFSPIFLNSGEILRPQSAETREDQGAECISYVLHRSSSAS